MLEMSNKAFWRLVLLIVVIIVLIALLINVWPVLSMADRYIGIVCAIVMVLTGSYFIVRAIQTIVKHQEEIAMTRHTRSLEQQRLDHEHMMSMRLLEHQVTLEQQRFQLEQHLQLTRLAPSEHGYHAVIERGTEGYTVVQVPYAGRHMPQLATGANEPQSRIPQRATTRVIEMPTQDYVLSQLRHNGLEVIPGVDVNTGECQILSIPDAVHFKLIGSSGFGKSCLAASLLDQATRTNTPDRLQVALLDLEHKTSRLFEDVPHIVEYQSGNRRIPLVATNADEVAQHLGYLKNLLTARAKLSEYDLQQLPIILIYVEEMLSLQYEVDPKLLDQMLADLSILALRARKYNMFLLACSQTDYSTDELKTAQKQFRSRIAFAIDTTAARAAGFMSSELIKENFKTAQKGDGRFVMETPGYAGICVAPTFDVRAMLLDRSTPVQERNTGPDLRIVRADSTPVERTANAVQNEDERAIDASAEDITEVLRLHDLGWGKQAICEKVWDVKKGGSQKWKEAAARYDAIIASYELEEA